MNVLIYFAQNSQRFFATNGQTGVQVTFRVESLFGFTFLVAKVKVVLEGGQVSFEDILDNY